MGNLLRNTRKDCGMTLEEVSAIIKVSRQEISMWELGARTPNGRNLIALSRLLNLSPEAILDDIGKK